MARVSLKKQFAFSMAVAAVGAVLTGAVIYIVNIKTLEKQREQQQETISQTKQGISREYSRALTRYYT